MSIRRRNTVMQPKTPNPFRLALFWLGIQAVWGALLGISLQSRTIELAPGDALIAYGRLATAGAIVAAIVQVVVGFYSDARRRGGSRRVEFYVAGALGGAVAIEFFFGAAYAGRAYDCVRRSASGVELGDRTVSGDYSGFRRS